MNQIKDLIDIISNPASGIFYLLYNSQCLSENVQALIDSNYTYYDISYYLTHSGFKYSTPLYDSYIEGNINSLQLTNVISSIFKDKWDKLYIALFSDYNPIENYSMTEHEEVNSNIDSSSDGFEYGFNTSSSSPVPQNKVEANTQGSKDDNFRDLTRSGNIGVTTSQQMITSELMLRRNKLIDIIMNDIDTLLCLKIYN